MKKYALLFLLISFTGIAQSLNDYQYVIVPIKFNFLKENQYRVNTIIKHKLNGMGFKAFYDNESLPNELASNRCEALTVNMEKVPAFMALKVYVSFTDCQNKEVFKSEMIATKEKDFNKAYQEVLDKVFQLISAQNYKYNGASHKSGSSNQQIIETQKTPEPTVVSSGKIKAEAIRNGFLLIDESSSKIVLRITKTSDPKTFLASTQEKQGVLIQKEDSWFFEYTLNDKLISEKIEVTF